MPAILHREPAGVAQRVSGRTADRVADSGPCLGRTAHRGVSAAHALWISGVRMIVELRLTMPPKVVGVVLAAGKSVRMGSRKASLAIDGRDTYLTRLLRTFGEAGGLAETVAVLGHDASAVEAELLQAGLAVRCVVNHGFEAGQLSSLIVGLESAALPGVEAILLGLVDAPLVSARTVQAVLGRYLETGAPVVRPVRGPQHGHPVLIDRALFGAIRQADPTVGAKPIVRAHVSPSGDVEVDDDGAFMDLDTREAHERAMRWWRTRRADLSPVALAAPDPR